MSILSPLLHGYSAAQEAVWDETIRQQLRTLDDGVPLSVFDWLDLNALAHHAFLSPKQEDRLWEWRHFTHTPIQRVTARRLIKHGLLMMCDANTGYCWLSARGLRKVSAVWQHMVETTNEAHNATAPRVAL